MFAGEEDNTSSVPLTRSTNVVIYHNWLSSYVVRQGTDLRWRVLDLVLIVNILQLIFVSLETIFAQSRTSCLNRDIKNVPSCHDANGDSQYLHPVFSMIPIELRS